MPHIATPTKNISKAVERKTWFLKGESGTTHPCASTENLISDVSL
jgi:hypothetical protein